MAEFDTESDFFIVRSKNRKEFKEIELLFLSRSIPFTVQVDFLEKKFFIPLNYEDFAKNEIRKFQQENSNWPPLSYIKKQLHFGFSYLHLAVVLCLAFFHWRTTHISSYFNWLEYGRFSADRVLAGDWWRTITALTLHVDDPHLLSNFFGLLLFVSGVSRFSGVGISWLLVLLSGAFGNYLNALFYQTAHNSIGASTAVFAAVGIMGAFGMKQYYQEKQFNFRYFVPLIGALGLYAMLGTSPQTDVLAHFFGFLSGVGLGLLFLPLIGSKILENLVVQVVALSLFCFIIYFCWNV